MIKSILASLCAATLFALAPHARAATLVDTGPPDGNAVGALAFDAFDWVAGQVAFTQATRIAAIQGHILGGTAGETFDVSLFSADAGAGPGTLLYTTTATFGADGWNGIAGLQGWNVAAGRYWIEFEIQGADTLGAGSVTGALFDTGAPHPLATTAWTSDAGFSYADAPLSVGLRVSAVPWPASATLALAGVALLATLSMAGRARRR